MASKIGITLYGREYTVNCDPGQEDRLRQIVGFVETRMKDVSELVGNTTENRLLMLTCLHMADELLDIRNRLEKGSIDNEELLIAAVEHLQQRVAHIASQIGGA